MSDVEMVIRLVDGSPVEQAAIESTPPREDQNPAPVSPSSRTDSATHSDTSRPADTTVANDKSAADAMLALRETLETLNERLTPDLFDRPVAEFSKQIEAIMHQERQPGTMPPPVQTDANRKRKRQEKEEDKPSSTAGRVMRSAMDWIGQRSPLTRRAAIAFQNAQTRVKRAGQTVRNWASRPGKTRAGRAMRRFATSIVGRAQPTTAAPPVSSATTSGAAAGARALPSVATATGGSAGAALGPVAIGAGAVAAAFVVVAAAAYGLKKAFETTADSIERFSPEVSRARLQRQVNTELATLDRARRVGPELGRFEQAKTNLDAQLQELWTEILELLVQFEPVMTKGVESIGVLVEIARLGVSSIDVQIAVLENVKAALTFWDSRDDQRAQDNLRSAVDQTKAIKQSIDDAVNKLLGGAQNNPQNQVPPLLQLIRNAQLPVPGQAPQRGIP